MENVSSQTRPFYACLSRRLRLRLRLLRLWLLLRLLLLPLLWLLLKLRLALRLLLLLLLSQPRRPLRQSPPDAGRLLEIARWQP